MPTDSEIVNNPEYIQLFLFSVFYHYQSDDFDDEMINHLIDDIKNDLERALNHVV
jgi:hypothetical protein